MAEKKATILVKSKPERFRRAGIAFTRDGVEIDPATLTDAQLAAIRAEPNLIVIGDDAEDAKGEGKKAPAKKAGK